MARISGVDLPGEKRTDIGLTSIYGIGRANVIEILKETNIDGAKRVKDLSDEEVNRLARAIDKVLVEGDLRRQLTQNIRRLDEIGAYRGIRHRRGLPVRGQRTRSNARTKKGKKKTVGTVRKDVVARTGGAK